MEADCNDILALDLGEKGRDDFRERYGLFIDIDGERKKIHFNDLSPKTKLN